ncbi:hypothetical protein KCP75_01675 [Salmonella enterica subsp. enterica]|nr:hypothetical protein KCP75_01675 [Salmonella enterica subsp. enterica]
MPGATTLSRQGGERRGQQGDPRPGFSISRAGGSSFIELTHGYFQITQPRRAVYDRRCSMSSGFQTLQITDIHQVENAARCLQGWRCAGPAAGVSIRSPAGITDTYPGGKSGQ